MKYKPGDLVCATVGRGLGVIIKEVNPDDPAGADLQRYSVRWLHRSETSITRACWLRPLRGRLSEV